MNAPRRGIARDELGRVVVVSARRRFVRRDQNLAKRVRLGDFRVERVERFLRARRRFAEREQRVLNAFENRLRPRAGRRVFYKEGGVGIERVETLVRDFLERYRLELFLRFNILVKFF